MSVTCVLYESLEAARLAGGGTVPIGAMWYDHDLLEKAPQVLTAHYRDVVSKERAPLYVKLPDGTFFCVDQRCSRDESGWTVTGDPPCITVHPSIKTSHRIDGRDVVRYHGHLKGGVLEPCGDSPT